MRGIWPHSESAKNSTGCGRKMKHCAAHTQSGCWKVTRKRVSISRFLGAYHTLSTREWNMIVYAVELWHSSTWTACRYTSKHVGSKQWNSEQALRSPEQILKDYLMTQCENGKTIEDRFKKKPPMYIWLIKGTDFKRSLSGYLFSWLCLDG